MLPQSLSHHSRASKTCTFPGGNFLGLAGCLQGSYLLGQPPGLVASLCGHLPASTWDPSSAQSPPALSPLVSPSGGTKPSRGVQVLTSFPSCPGHEAALVRNQEC